MALSSAMTPLGSPLPDISLPTLDGDMLNVSAYADGRPIVLAFVCNHCPYVQHIEAELGRFAADYPNVATVAICSNDAVTYPDDDVPGLRDQVARANWQFPYLVDADQQVALHVGAVCTPDFFVFDRDGVLAYRGAFDESRPRQPTAVTGSDLRSAIQALLDGAPVPEPHRPSMGCGIKWRPENSPPQ